MSSAGHPPVVSVIMATYNRSNIIGYAIRSLLRSTLTDWELIVVGDACTDDTEDVVRSFGDPRIHYHSMPVNFGEQSGPNNVGGTLARGRYVAYLNHDDLYFPDHLATAVARLEQGDVDLVYGIGMRVAADGTPELVGGVTRSGTYSTAAQIPATLWVFRRELIERVGPWPAAAEVRWVASSTWLHRAFESGARLTAHPHLAAVILSSVRTPRAYSERADADHRHWFARMHASDFPTAELLAASLIWEDARYHLRFRRFFDEGTRLLARAGLRALGVVPPAPKQLLRFWRRGSYIRHLRTVRGLPPEPGAPNRQKHSEELVR